MSNEPILIDYTIEALKAGKAFIPTDNYCLIGKTLESQLYFLLDEDHEELYVCHKKENGEMIIWNDGKVLPEFAERYKSNKQNKHITFNVYLYSIYNTRPCR